MNKKHKLAVGFVSAALLVSATALAGTWSSQSLLDVIEIDATGTSPSTYVGFASAVTGKPACGTSGWALASGGAENVKAMTAILNSAFLAGRNVEVYWDGTCSSSYARFTAVRMR